MRWLLVLLSVALPLVLKSSCATPQYSQSDKLKAQMSDTQQKKLDEFKAEIAIGRNMAGRLLAFYGINDDEALAGYVNQVGAYVATFSDFPDRRYMFQILDTDAVNAFAAPGGYILVTRGAIRHAENEAELAHVLGHEVAHVGLKHMFESLKGMSKDEMEKAAKEADQAGLKMSQELKARKRPTVTDDSGALLARYLSGSAAGLSVLSAAKAGMSLILEKGLGAEKEFEADASGTKYAVRAGYHPKALMNYLCRLERTKAAKDKKGKKAKHNQNQSCRLPKSAFAKKKKKPATILDKTHPSVPQRIANIKKTLYKIDAADSPGARGEARFEKYHKLIPASKT